LLEGCRSLTELDVATGPHEERTWLLRYASPDALRRLNMGDLEFTHDEYRAFVKRHCKLEMLAAGGWVLSHAHVGLLVRTFTALHTLEVSDIGDNAYCGTLTILSSLRTLQLRYRADATSTIQIFPLPQLERLHLAIQKRPRYSILALASLLLPNTF
jgi:hypothetical protein